MKTSVGSPLARRVAAALTVLPLLALLSAAGCSSRSSPPPSAAPSPSYDTLDPGYLMAVRATGTDNPGAAEVAAWDQRLDQLHALCGGATVDIAQIIIMIQRHHRQSMSYEDAAANWLSTIRGQGRHRNCTLAAAGWTS